MLLIWNAPPRAELLAISRSRTAEVRMVERVRIVLTWLKGKEIQQVAQEIGASIPTGGKWRSRFARDGGARFKGSGAIRQAADLYRRLS